MSADANAVVRYTVRLAEARVDDPDGVSLKRLRDAVAGKSVDWPRAHAMTRLLESDFPNKHRDFEQRTGQRGGQRPKRVISPRCISG